MQEITNEQKLECYKSAKEQLKGVNMGVCVCLERAMIYDCGQKVTWLSYKGLLQEYFPEVNTWIARMAARYNISEDRIHIDGLNAALSEAPNMPDDVNYLDVSWYERKLFVNLQIKELEALCNG